MSTARQHHSVQATLVGLVDNRAQYEQVLLAPAPACQRLRARARVWGRSRKQRLCVWVCAADGRL